MSALLAPEPLVFLDLETTGANFANDRIIEIGLIEIAPDGAREWSVLVNPETRLSPFITGLTGIDDAMLNSAPTFQQIAPALLDRLHGRLLIAHNARFDYGFLKGEFGRLGVNLRLRCLCTVKLSRKLFPEHHRHNLDTLIVRHGLCVHGGRHRALTDARLLWDLWQSWHRLLPAATIRCAIAAIVGHPELPAQIDSALIDDLPEAAGAYALYAEDGRLLLSRRSSNLRRQVLEHFTAGNRDKPLYRDTWRIDWREAAGEMGARLCEIELAGRVSSAAPARAGNELCSWQLEQAAPGDFRPRLALASEIDFALVDDLFGLYVNRREAQRSLRLLADAHRLCHKQLGLEQTATACSAYRQKNCRGVCIGKEAPAAHGARLLSALARWKLRMWPYRGPVALVERDEFGMREDIHLIDRWRLTGTVQSEQALAGLLADGPNDRPFDPDIYRIVKRFLESGQLRVRPLPSFSP
ncbi:MAG: ethanolamine utilization protein [Candidatus Accumulibacter sp.]|uniref:3'-5' exonuclease family protein n=1 Tax=Accumulibacter sp. TaxID=2053492 RepID=UPI001A58FDB7|nr:3'-5' exonuclease family protein [Accumulibacter sp.]MBL8395592.1 ethanolamine utilization protein [Accumulibacter sp.]